MRGRSAVPLTFLRIRPWTAWRTTARDFLAILTLSLLGGLAGLELHRLVCVAHALALVGVGTAKVVQVGAGLSDHLLVDARDDERRLVLVQAGLLLALDLDVDARRRQELDQMGVAQREHEARAAQLGFVADADDVELAGEAIGDALDGVREQRPCEAMAGSVLARVGAHPELPVLFGDGDPRRDRRDQLALRAGDLDLALVDRHLDAGGYRDVL